MKWPAGKKIQALMIYGIIAVYAPACAGAAHINGGGNAEAGIVRPGTAFNPEPQSVMPIIPSVPLRQTLVNKHLSKETFCYILSRAREYKPVNAIAGVIPHHLTAAEMIGGFFYAAAESGMLYDTVVLVGPNHTGGPNHVSVSLKDWDVGDTVSSDTEILKQVLDIKLDESIVAEDDTRMEDDHALSVFIPLISHYWPEAGVAPVLVSRALSYGDTLRLADELAEIIARSGKKILLLCSVDFSHGLTPEEALIRDSETLKAVRQNGYAAIHNLSSVNIDSPAALIIFLRYVEAMKAEMSVIDHADASHFIHVGEEGTTSYFVLAGENGT